MTKEIPRDAFRLLWQSDYWDGMLSGMLMYQERKCWFFCFEEAYDYAKYDDETETFEDLGWWRRYKVVELSDEQIADEEHWHDLFYKYVATYSTYDDSENLITDAGVKYKDDSGISHSNGTRDPKLHHLFFEKQKVENAEARSENYRENREIGWIEL